MSYPETAREALAQWDAGDIVWTAELGGMGPGYEQAIHVLIFEMIRDIDPLLARDDREKDFRAAADACVHRVDRDGHDLGFSGAQVGAAMHFAFRALRDGWRVQLEKYKSDDPERVTMVSRCWPHIDVRAAVRAGGVPPQADKEKA